MSDLLLDQLQRSLGAAYVIERELGGGGMSRVFLAEEVRLHRRVVIKVLSPELAQGVSAERFEREITLAAQLQHPHIVPLLSAGATSDGLPFYCMPFVPGDSLRHRMTATPALTPGDAAGVLRDIAQALAYAHRSGVVHRDVKPENVLLTDGAAAVSDFGIAKALRASRTQAPGGTMTAVGTSIGTPAYMAPEQAAGDDVDARADVYAWGVIAYELLSGHHPFEGRHTAQQLIAAHMGERPAPLVTRAPDTPPALARVVMQALEKDPARRPASGSELVDLLTRAGSSTSAARPGRRALVIGAAVVLLAGATGALVARRAHDSAGDARSGAASADASRSLVVLALANVGGDTSNAYFADGLTEELTSAVARLPGLRVVGGSSAAAWKGQATPDVHDIGVRLGVGHVLNGSVRRAGARVRIVAQLTSTRDGRIVWSDSYDGGLSDVFSLQAEIARKVADGLRLSLAVADSARLTRAGTSDPAAHDLFLRARVLHLQYGEQNIRNAIELYRQAVARDPKYVEAWAGEGMAWFNLADEYVAPREAFTHIRPAAARALALDSTNGTAQILSAIAIPNSTAVRVRAALGRRAAELAPNDVPVQLFAGMLIAPIDPAGAVALCENALSLDPLSPVSWLSIALMQHFAGRGDDAERSARRAIQLAPDLGFAHSMLGLTLLDKHRDAEALAAFQQALASGDHDMAAMGAGLALVKLGRTAEARKYLAGMEDAATRRYVIGDWVARLALALGDREKALTWLERAAREGSSYTRLVDVEPQFRELAGEPRFEAVRRSVGLAGK
jgi:serine/threonine-protein kinase